MGMVAPQQRIASAYVVFFGTYGQVSRYAEQRGVCRQWVYQEAHWVQNRLQQTQEENQQLHKQVQGLRQQVRTLEQRLAQAVVLDKQKQDEFATVCQALGVSLPNCWSLLDVLIPGQQQSVPSLGRASQAAGKKAGQLLAVCDAWAQNRLRDAAADEIYVSAPVLMVVEQESLCWMTGRLSTEVSGEAWVSALRCFPQLEQASRDGGKGLEKGLRLLNAQRQAQGQSPVREQGDHWHAMRGAGIGLRQQQEQAQQALAKAEAAQKAVEKCQRHGTSQWLATLRAKAAWRRAERVMDRWCSVEACWRKAKQALELFTPQGTLNTRARATRVLQETLPYLPQAFAKTRRQLQRPEMLNYLDQVQQQFQALPYPEEVKKAALRQEGLRRRPELLKGEGGKAAALRGVLLVCAVVLTKAGAVGQQAQAAVRDLLRRAYRASSLVECINSVVRMHQGRHRKMTQGLLDLKRLHWNCHTFRTGRRRGTTPYQRLAVPWPEGLRWWDVLKLTPEQLGEKLSTAKKTE